MQDTRNHIVWLISRLCDEFTQKGKFVEITEVLEDAPGVLVHHENVLSILAQCPKRIQLALHKPIKVYEA